MAYTEEAVKAKLSALNETQEGIVTVAQWVMFHRRNADRTVTLWLNRLKDSGSNKRLNLIYLANEVVQQSKARSRPEFPIAFSPIIGEATAIAYKGATSEVQNKLRRVVEVWRQRQIFEPSIQEAIESRVDELDRSRSSMKKPALGGSLFSSSAGSSAPAEIQPLVPLQTQLSKAAATSTTAVPTADGEYDKLMDPGKAVPTPPVYAARLSALLKTLASAESAVSESIKARRALLEGLEKLVESNRTSLTADESKHAELTSRKGGIETKKREVEDAIMRGLSAENSPTTPADGRMNGNTMSPSNGNTLSVDAERPDVEELTPPPPEALTPREESTPTTGQGESNNGPASTHSPNPLASPPPAPAPSGASPGSDLLSSLSVPAVRQFSGSPLDGGSAPKKRRLEQEDDDVFGGGGDAMVDLDEDVAELLRAESGGR